MCCNCEGIGIGTAPASKFASCVTQMYATGVGDGTGTLWRVVIRCVDAIDVWAEGIRPPIERKNPNSRVEAALTCFDRAFCLERRDEGEK